jgi:hypothetical protein
VNISADALQDMIDDIWPLSDLTPDSLLSGGKR